MVELRKRFPGPISGLLLARKKTNMVEYVCETFRLAFEEEGFIPPPVYFLEEFFPSKLENVCFETILIPKVTNLYLGSPGEAEELRNAGLSI
jgi:hypothetical protein